MSIGFRFSNYIVEKESGEITFEKLLNLFKELLTYTAGNVTEALNWLTELDKEHQLTNNNYGIGDFIEELTEKGFLRKDSPSSQEFLMTSKMEQTIRQKALEEIFGKLKKTNQGNHRTLNNGLGDEKTANKRPYQFGDKLEQISITDSIKNAQINNGIGGFIMTEKDLEIVEQESKSQTSTVVMIDISHSMILYGEDRITPAKKVAMALSELILKKYPKDTLDIIVFGNDAWQIQIKDLPYLKVGPYHTNTVAGLELSMDILRRRKNPNKHIFMITDGKPTCIKEHGHYYKNSFGLDKKILNKTFNLGRACKKLGIKVTTFMIAQDPYLQQFVHQFTEVCKGKAFYTSLQGLGTYLFEDFERNKKKRF